jgi:hypothetical protein
MRPRTKEKARPVVVSAARDVGSGQARRSVWPLLGFLLFAATVRAVSCEDAPVDAEGQGVSLLPLRTSPPESLPPPMPPVPRSSRRSVSGNRGATSGGGRAVAGYRASVAHAAPSTGSSSERRPPGRRKLLTQALNSSSFTVSQIDRLDASDGAALDRLAISMAIDGDTIVMGAPGDDGGRGSAYMFTRSVEGSPTATWTQRAKLVASNGAVGDSFGHSVGISGDTIVVGARVDVALRADSGIAYIFEREVAGDLTAGWAQRAKLLASDGTVGDLFGHSVAISGDTVAVGTPRGPFQSGSVYIFTRNVVGTLTGRWTQQAILVASQDITRLPGYRNSFGNSVALSGDTVAVGDPIFSGDTLAVWERIEDLVSDIRFTGSVYVFTRDVAGSLTSTWTQRAKLLASNDGTADITTFAFCFGHSVALSGDTLAVGAPHLDDSFSGASLGLNNHSNAGSAHIFTRDVAGDMTATWTPRAKLLASGGIGGDAFGSSIAISDSEDTIVVGAQHSDHGSNNTLAQDGSGSAYIFTRDNQESPSTTWTQRHMLLPSHGADGDNFGSSAAISRDTVVVGAAKSDGRGSAFGPLENSGSAYVFAPLFHPPLGSEAMPGCLAWYGPATGGSALQVNGAASHSFQDDHYVYVVAEITTPPSWSVGTTAVFLWGATTACGGLYGGTTDGKWFIGVQCNANESDVPYLHNAMLATNTRYTVEFSYNTVAKNVQIWQNSIEQTPAGGVTKNFILSKGYATIGAGNHDDGEYRPWAGVLHSVSFVRCALELRLHLVADDLASDSFTTWPDRSGSGNDVIILDANTKPTLMVNAFQGEAPG